MEKEIQWPGWQTVRLIGRGSFGAVYEIQREIFGDIEKAALKVISIPQNSSDIEEMYNDGYDDESITSTFQSHLKSIVAEYSLMRKMNGSLNIVNCDDVRYVQHDDGIGWDIFIKMELLTPLVKSLPEGFSEETVVKVGKDMCAALELCKSYEIVHRDIKPQNIFVSRYGDYKLGDFGIAKTVEKTMGGTKIGTYKYMAPEVYNNQPYGSGADIYSLGLVLYWLSNERRMPFTPLPPEKLKVGMDEEARYRRFSGEPLPAPAHGSDGLKRVILKACAYDPKERYQSATEMLAELEHLNQDTAAPIVPVPMPIPLEGEDGEKLEPVQEKPENPVTKSDIPVVDITTDDVQELQDDDATNSVFDQEPKKIPVPPVVSGKTEDATAEWDKKTDKEVYHADNSEKRKTPILVAVMVIVAIVLFLLLKSCDSGTSNSDVSGPDITGPGNVGMIEDQETQAPTKEESEAELPKESSEPETTEKEQETESSKAAETTAKMITVENVVGWSRKDAEAKLKKLGFKVEITQIYDNSAGEGGVVGQSLEAGSSHTPGTTITLTVSKGPEPTWSDWTTSLPSGVSDSGYYIESKTQYIYRTKEYTTSSSSSLSGWGTPYDSKMDWGEPGAWSDWSTTAVSESDGREVETMKQYRYRDKEYTSSRSSSMSGWTLVDSQSYYTEYGSWSSWSDSPAYDSETRDAEERTVWPYYYFYCYSCGQRSPYQGYACERCGTYPVKMESGTVAYFPSSWDNSTHWGGDRYYQEPDGTPWWNYTDGSPKTQYRYRDREKCTDYIFEKWGDWTSWSESSVSGSDTRQVETRTVYRYRDSSEVYTYYYWRWTDWSNYTDERITANDDREVNTRTLYRYKQK